VLAVLRSGNDEGQVDAGTVEKASLTAATLANIDTEFTLQLETLTNFPETKDWSLANEFRDSIARVETAVQEAQALQTDPADSQTLATLDEIAKGVKEISIAGESVFLLTDADQPEQAATARSQIEDLIANLRPMLAELSSEPQRQIDLALASKSSEDPLLLWALLGLAGLALVVGMWSAVWLPRSVLRPLASIQASVRAIASGDVATRPRISGSPEFESLAKDLDRMTVALLAKETAEAGIARAEAKYRQLAERTADLVFRIDLQKGLTYANPAWERVTGFTLEELASGPEIVGRIIHPDQWQPFVTLWRTVLSGNMPEGPLALKCLHKNGQTLWLTFNILPTYDENRHLISIEGSGRDTTMISHLVREVRQRDDQLRLFLNLSNAAATAAGFDEAADKALEAVLELLPQAEAGFLMAYNRYRQSLEVHAVRNLDQKTLSKLAVKPGEGLIGQTFQSGETQLFNSMEKLAAAGGLASQADDLLKKAAEESGAPQSIVCVPLGIGESPFGCLVLVNFSEGAFFQPSDLDLLQAAASQIAVPLENARLRAETELRAITDDLTGLYSRAYFHQRLSEEIERAKRYKHGLAVIIADIDNFKGYNDARGQAAGDTVLRLAADSLRSQMRRSDVACRYSGDEFAAILMHADPARTEVVLERIAKSLAKKLSELKDPTTADLSLSAGLACYPDDATTADDLVRLADISLYSAKLSNSKAPQAV
jgi:diguanylate cyclase (GGDEF)-like protein/PAS domain S-box-containing protein